MDLRNVIGLKIMSSKFKELNLVYMGSVFQYSEEDSKEDCHEFPPGICRELKQQL